MSHPLAGQSPLLNIMSKAANKAARKLLRDFGEIENLQVSLKGPGDFVSNADYAAESIIKEELLTARPNYGFLLEEGGEIKGEDFNNTWIIDPLDGTTNFLHGFPHFAISIALVRQNEVIAGLVLDPVRDEMFYAEKGKGAYLNNRRIRVSNRRDPRECVFASGLSSKDKNAFLVGLMQAQKVIPNIASFRCLGATALDLAYVAAGRLDGFWHLRFSPWDIAAGLLIIREAGGYVTDILGNQEMESADSIVATNPYLYPVLCKALKEVRERVENREAL